MKLNITKQFQDYLKSIGIDIRSLLIQAGIPDKSWKEELTLNSLDYHRLLLCLDQALTEENILALSQISNIQLFVPSFFAALSAKNGLEVIERFAKFKKLLGPIDLDIIYNEQTVSIHFSYTHKQLELPKFSVLNEQLLILDLLRTGSKLPIKPLILESPFTDGEASSLAFGIKAQKSNFNQIAFDRADLEQTFVTQNNIMWQYLEPELHQNLAKLLKEKKLVAYVQEALFSAIPSGHFAVEDIAHQLGLSVRSLQRNLAAEATTFKQQVQTVQKTMAFSYLKMGLSTTEIAQLLGYTEVNAFSRAFKSWTGQTPSSYRKQESLAN